MKKRWPGQTRTSGWSLWFQVQGPLAVVEVVVVMVVMVVVLGGGGGGDDRGKMLRMMRVTAPAQIHIL